MISLKPMEMSDADKMLEWKNYPETRKYAIVTHDEIKKEDHYAWLEKNIQYFQVIQGDNARVGAIRIQDGEISIWIDQKFRGMGIAAKVLNGVAEMDMTAKIVEGNISSMRAFIDAGFKPTRYIEFDSCCDNYYIFQK